jgi:hypothetical protein
MKKSLFLCALVFAFATFSCTEDSGLTEAEIVDGLKTALNVGTDSTVKKVSATNGYYKDAAIKIFLPPEADVIINNISSVPGGEEMLENVIKSINLSAEDAAKGVKPIFVDAVTKLTISDGMSILKGTDDAATQYLKTNTYAKLKGVFTPKMDSSLSKPLFTKGVSAKSLYKDLVDAFNLIAPLIHKQPVNSDLTDFVTGKALDGLFKKVADEEYKIRKDPLARVTDILRKVFSTLD